MSVSVDLDFLLFFFCKIRHFLSGKLRRCVAGFKKNLKNTGLKVYQKSNKVLKKLHTSRFISLLQSTTKPSFCPSVDLIILQKNQLKCENAPDKAKQYVPR
jgi:hypothetical protein